MKILKNGGKNGKKSVAGQYLEKTKGGYKDVDTGKVYKDPNGVVKMDKNGYVMDLDYVLSGDTIQSVKRPS